MIVNINASLFDFEETLRVLDYAALAKQIQPIKSTLSSLKSGLVSEKKSKICKENEQEQEKKIQRLEEIISNLNDQLLINNLLNKFNNILDNFNQNNQKIFELQRKDLLKFKNFDETFTVQIFAKTLKNDIELSFLEEKEDFQSFLAQNPENCLKTAKFSQRDASLNTSPCEFLQKKPIFFEEKQTSPINFSENASKSIEKSLETASFYDFKGKNAKKRNNYQKKDKENDCLAINSKKKKPRKPRKNAEKSKIFEESVEIDCEKEEEDSLLEKNLENYAFCRETPILKRLRVRPNAKKHQCF